MSLVFELGPVRLINGDETLRPRPSGSGAPPVELPVQVPDDPEPEQVGVVDLIDYATAPDIPLPTPTRADSDLPVPLLATPPAHDSEDYGAAALALLPQGRAWPRDRDSVQSAVMTALGKTLARVDGDANALLRGVVPGARSWMLPEWEATLGLPHKCFAPIPPVDERLRQVRAAFSDSGGLSRARYIAFAADLGFEIELEVGPAADFTFAVRVLSSDGTHTPAQLLCAIKRIAPAEVTVTLLP